MRALALGPMRTGSPQREHVPPAGLSRMCSRIVRVARGWSLTSVIADRVISSLAFDVGLLVLSPVEGRIADWGLDGRAD